MPLLICTQRERNEGERKKNKLSSRAVNFMQIKSHYYLILFVLIGVSLVVWQMNWKTANQPTQQSTILPEVPMSSVKTTEAFTRVAERFADMQVLRYRIDGFDGLTLSQKTFLYYLQEAALSGRDMGYDQYYKHNLLVRKTIEQIVAHYAGDRHSKDFEKFMTYAKKMWASNGIHNHYTSDKFKPDFSKE